VNEKVTRTREVARNYGLYEWCVNNSLLRTTFFHCKNRDKRWSSNTSSLPQLFIFLFVCNNITVRFSDVCWHMPGPRSLFMTSQPHTNMLLKNVIFIKRVFLITKRSSLVFLQQCFSTFLRRGLFSDQYKSSRNQGRLRLRE